MGNQNQTPMNSLAPMMFQPGKQRFMSQNASTFSPAPNVQQVLFSRENPSLDSVLVTGNAVGVTYGGKFKNTSNKDVRGQSRKVLKSKPGAPKKSIPDMDDQLIENFVEYNKNIIAEL